MNSVAEIFQYKLVSTSYIEGIFNRVNLCKNKKTAESYMISNIHMVHTAYQMESCFIVQSLLSHYCF